MIKNNILRVCRILLAIIVLGAFIAYFVDFTEKVPHKLAFLAKLQFIPSLLAGSFAVFGALVLVTLLFGRIYCSVVCPLGILQDVIGFFGRRIARLADKFKKDPAHANVEGKPVVKRKPKPLRNYQYGPNHKKIRVAFLALAILSTVAGGFYFSLIEPYGVFGRIALNLLKPIHVMINNGLYDYYSSKDVVSNFYYYALRPESIGALVVGSLSFVVLCVFAGRWGRLYCNTVCPVGTMLGVLSMKALFRTRIDASKCVKCGLCSKRCKSSCIDFKNKEVDSSRCVVCFDCFSACKKDALYFGLKRPEKSDVPQTDKSTSSPDGAASSVAFDENRPLDSLRGFDPGKRQFLALSVAATTAALASVARSQEPTGPIPAQNNESLDDAKPEDYGLTPIKREYTITPPGSLSHRHFQMHCVGCQLCVAKCPARILKPSGFENGLRGFMQPRVDFSHGFCNYDCTLCGEVCPAGAIKLFPKEEKQLIQMGHVVFIKDNCIVYAQDTSCGACSEHCPTQALHMVPYKGTLTIPEVNVELCVGCGGCEYICPARPFRAVYIEGNPTHLAAKPVEKQETIEVEEIDFGF